MFRIKALQAVVLWTLLEIWKKAIQDQSIAQEVYLVSSDPENFVSDYADKVEHEFDKIAGLEKRIQKSK